MSWKLVAECAAGKEGDELLKHHGEATNALNPKVSFIPTVLLDQVILWQVMYNCAKKNTSFTLVMATFFLARYFAVWEVGKGSTCVHI